MIEYLILLVIYFDIFTLSKSAQPHLSCTTGPFILYKTISALAAVLIAVASQVNMGTPASNLLSACVRCEVTIKKGTRAVFDAASRSLSALKSFGNDDSSFIKRI